MFWGCGESKSRGESIYIFFRWNPAQFFNCLHLGLAESQPPEPPREFEELTRGLRMDRGLGLVLNEGSCESLNIYINIWKYTSAFDGFISFHLLLLLLFFSSTFSSSFFFFFFLLLYIYHHHHHHHHHHLTRGSNASRSPISSSTPTPRMRSRNSVSSLVPVFITSSCSLFMLLLWPPCACATRRLTSHTQACAGSRFSSDSLGNGWCLVVGRKVWVKEMIRLWW